MDGRTRDLTVLATFALFFFLYFNLRSLHSAENDLGDLVWADENTHTHESGIREQGADVYDGSAPANETLGFGAIIAVSKEGSKRRKGLLEAAQATELQVTIPDQPKWTDEDIEQLRDPEYSIVSKGSAMAWLGHLNAVQWFLDSNLTTALIIEDDVDWDIHIRHHQIPLIAAQTRALLAANPARPRDHYSSIREHNTEHSYWGDMTQWEVLYLGHCGDNFDLKYWPDLPHNIFPDKTVPAFEDLHPDTQMLLWEAGIGNKQRMVHRSKQPLCSFAYALNRKSAQRMVAELSHEEWGHGTWSFDVRLLEACRDLGWKCWTANPELFHHQDEHDSAITEVNGKPLFELQSKHGDGSTPNIGCGARNSRFSTTNPQRRKLIKQIAMHEDVCSYEDLEGREPHDFQKDPL